MNSPAIPNPVVRSRQQRLNVQATVEAAVNKHNTTFTVMNLMTEINRHLEQHEMLGVRTISMALNALVKDGRLERVAMGKYRPAQKVEMVL